MAERVPSTWVQLLETVGRFRCLSAEQLFALAPSGLSRDAYARSIRAIRAAGWLRGYFIPGTQRRVLHLTARALRSIPSLRARYSFSHGQPTVDWAILGWQRAEACRRLSVDGWVVGRDLTALAALRGHLAEHAATPTLRTQVEQVLATPRDGAGSAICEPWRCSCGFVAAEPSVHSPLSGASPCRGTMRKADLTRYDIAYRPKADAAPFLLLVDNPYRAILGQLNELPLRTSLYDTARRGPVYQPALEVLYLPPDDGSVWSAEAQDWVQRGPRLRQFMHYVTRLPSRSFGGSALEFPFCRTVSVRSPIEGFYFHQLRNVAARRREKHA